MKKPKVIVKPRLKHRKTPVWGIATISKNPIIELDRALKGFDHLTILTHEAIHLAYPKMKERDVRSGAKLVASVLWGQRYRRFEQ